MDFGYLDELVVGDLNSDQSLDVITNENIWLNDGMANFSLHPVMPAWGGYYMSILSGDLDGDGDLDIINQISWDMFLVWLNDGTGVMSIHSMLPVPEGVAQAFASTLADFDGDGDLDLFAFAEAFSWADTPAALGESWRWELCSTPG